MSYTSCLKYSLLTCSLISLSGCGLASMPKGYSPIEKQAITELNTANYVPRTADERAAVLTQDLFAQTAFWSREYDLNPADLEAAVNLASTLRRLGNPGKSIEVATQTRAMYPRDVALMTELGASLIANDEPQKAVKVIDGAIRQNPQDSRLWSMKGAALDQLEMFTQARQHYAKGLQLSPNDPKIMTNVGLSYALEGDPRTAEVWLRRAANDPNAPKSTRENLALILGLQGKTDEAEQWTQRATSNTASYTNPMRGPSTQGRPQNQTPMAMRGPARRTQTPRRPQTSNQQQAPARQARPTRQIRTAPTAGQITPTRASTGRTLSNFSTQLSGGPKTASDAARMAAKQMAAPKPQNPADVLSKISQNNQSKRAIAAQQNAYNQQMAQQRAYGQRPAAQQIAQYPGRQTQYGAPQQYAPQAYTQSYQQPQQQMPVDNTRVPARTRR